MIFHENRLLADYSHEISYLIIRKLGKILQNLLSAAVVFGALRVDSCTYIPFTTSHYFCHLFSLLFMFLGSQYFKQYGPRLLMSVGSGFIVFASMIKSSLKCT